MPHTDLPGGRVPIRMWANPADVETQAMGQLRNIANLPAVHGLAVMPDVHYGIGATVGSVIAMRDAVSPAAVGVDIGCGVAGVRTSLTASDLPDDLRGLRSAIEAAIPVGYAMHDEPVFRRPRFSGRHSDEWGSFWSAADDFPAPLRGRLDKAMRQIGTLGGGNHFCEVCVDADQNIWLLLHSGSRNIGKELAEHHIGVARALPHNQDLPDRDLAVFHTGTAEMDAYRRDLWWAQEYASRNRRIMIELLQQVIRERFAQPVAFGDLICNHHNYVAEETHDGVELLVTRKGAIAAREGQLGIIPGSMGTGSYIVRGLGNPASFHSASHGAGRRMSRGQARRTFTAADLAAQTAGVECRKDAGVVDEIPAAYKDINQVIAQQADLVEVVAHLTQLICVKG